MKRILGPDLASRGRLLRKEKENRWSARVAGRSTRVHFHVHVECRERRPVSGNRSDPVHTGHAETHLGLRSERLSVNRRADVRIEVHLAWTPIMNPSDQHALTGRGRIVQPMRHGSAGIINMTAVKVAAPADSFAAASELNLRTSKRSTRVPGGYGRVHIPVHIEFVNKRLTAIRDWPRHDMNGSARV
jgi:hypothetical protein